MAKMHHDEVDTDVALSWGLIALPYYKDTNLPLGALARHALHEVLADDT